MNIGSEFNFFHFCVVIKEFDYTAIVVPLSTEKDNDAEWKSAGNLVVPIGIIDDMPKDKKPVYAMVNQIKTVSKQRLSDYYVKEENKHYTMTLDEDQMGVIFQTISTLGKQKIKIKEKQVETVDIGK
ncbi:type II toxin-antitoxin system PemK/MazF family toxin [Fictibacillus nanhaiensis]|nr:type II toxin-antitoxin system PemK/MazF family toxin [Fictibacillus nanhaiensis]